MTPQPCYPGLSAFQWRCTPKGIVEITLDSGSTYISCGAAGDINGVFSRVWNKAFEPTPLTWRTLPSDGEVLIRNGEWDKKAKVWRDVVRNIGHDSDAKRQRIAEDDLKRELRLLALVGEAVGMRLDAQRWRMLSPNAVLHPFFGPGVTVATDGVRVILFGFPRFGSDYTVAHRTNIIGPVTSTAVAVEDWDYANNSTTVAAKRTKKKVERASAQHSDALDLLKSLQLLLPSSE